MDGVVAMRVNVSAQNSDGPWILGCRLLVGPFDVGHYFLALKIQRSMHRTVGRLCNHQYVVIMRIIYKSI
jgi:hypothetical protein